MQYIKSLKRNKKYKYFFVCVILLSLFGCVKTQEQQISERIFTQRAEMISAVKAALDSSLDISPLSGDWKKIVESSISLILKDPDSAKYTFIDTPQYYGFSNRGKYRGDFNSGRSPILGYIGSVLVNAKNSYGGYTGNKLWMFIISDGKVEYLSTNPYDLWSSTADAVDHINRYEVIIKK